MKERNAALLLFLASILWGFTFVFQNQAADVIGAGTFNAIRMTIGFIVLLPLFIPIIKRHKDDKEYIRTLFKGGFILGIIIAAASFSQQIGIGLTTAGKAGFLTSLYSLIVPVLAIFTGKKTNFKTWNCIIVGLVGAFLVSINGDRGITGGDLLLFLCALLFAFQIIIIDIVGKKLEGIDLSALQFLFGGFFSLIFALFAKEEISVEVIKLAAVPILYAGIFSCGVAYTLQIVGQKYMHPAKATLILCLESVWAAVGGALILKETMTFKEGLGCALIFSAVIVSQLPSKVKKR